MSKKRFSSRSQYPHRQGPDGKPLCRWCGSAVPGRRRSFCSQACVDEYLVRRSPSWVRRLLRNRDKGVCALCGLDTLWLRRAVLAIRRRHGQIAYKRAETRLSARGFNVDRRNYWDADHIVPVSEGGGECGLDNYRTLCQPCHKRETAKLKRKQRLR